MISIAQCPVSENFVTRRCRGVIGANRQCDSCTIDGAIFLQMPDMSDEFGYLHYIGCSANPIYLKGFIMKILILRMTTVILVILFANCVEKIWIIAKRFSTWSLLLIIGADILTKIFIPHSHIVLT